MGFGLSRNARSVLTMVKVTRAQKMWRSKTHLNLVKKNEATQMVYVDAIGPGGESRAQQYAKKLFQLRNKGWGDEPEALKEVATRSRVSPRSFKRIMKGEVEAKESIGARIRNAYLAYCAELVSRLQHEIEVEQKVHGDAADFQDLGEEVEILARKIEAARKRQAPKEGQR
jgi:hypothetical protein